MIYRLKLGNPFETDAVVNFEEVNDRSDVEFLELLGNLEVQLFIDNHPSEGEPAVTVTYEMSDEAVIYGLGESMRGMNKRGYKVARRTIAKYRDQLDIPKARLRKEL